MKSVGNSREPLPERLPTLDEAKRDLLDKLKKSYIPPYIAFFRAIPWIGRRSATFQVIVYGLVLLVAGYLVGTVTNIRQRIAFSAYIWIVMLEIGFGLWALWYVRERTIDVLGEVLKVMTLQEQQIKKLDSCLRYMYSNLKRQLSMGVGMPVIVLILIAWLDYFDVIPDITFHPLFKAYVVMIAVPCFSVAGFGLWLAITSCYFIYHFTRIGKSVEIKGSVFFPGQTVEIVHLANLMSIYSVLFALAVSLVSILFAMLHFGIGVPPIDQTLFPYKITASIVLFMSSFVIIAYIFYPQWALRSMVVDRKSKVKRRIQKSIQESYLKERPLTSDELLIVEKHLEMFKEVDSSPNMPPLTVAALIRFILLVIWPTVLALLGIFRERVIAPPQ